MAFEVREARRGDEPAVADIHVRAWQEAYRGLMPDEFLDALDPRDRAARYRFEDPDGPTTLIAESAGKLLGFVTFGESRDDDAAGLAEVYALYVDPQRHARGVGRALMAGVRDKMLAQGFEAAVLWVLRGNDRAAAFYEREGWRRDGATRWEQPYGIRSRVHRFRRELRPARGGNTPRRGR